MMEWIVQPWPWYISGPLIGLIVPLLLLAGNKSLGVSSSLRHICAACFPADISFFRYNWKKEKWNLFFVAGIAVGAFIVSYFFTGYTQIPIAESTKEDLAALGITDFNYLMPVEIFSWDRLFSITGLIFFVLGGFLVGFGTRYAGGCTSGHSIMGLSNLQWPSLVATVSFMVGGLLMTHLLLPYIFKTINL